MKRSESIGVYRKIQKKRKFGDKKRTTQFKSDTCYVTADRLVHHNELFYIMQTF